MSPQNELVEAWHSKVMMRTPGASPRLLVSVRSRAEAVRALAGGAEILDVKEPSRGSLGMASIDTITAIANANESSAKTTPLSVALGEVHDWPPQSVYPELPSGITFAKLGLSRCIEKTDWQSEWRQVRTAFDRRSSSQLRWVAVAYADCDEAASPSISHILDAAIKAECAGLLIDTWTKDGRSLLDELDVKSLTQTANTCHAAGLFLALAGRIERRALSVLTNVPADVIAIRSAACHNANRTSELDTHLVKRFHEEMRRLTSTP